MGFRTSNRSIASRTALNGLYRSKYPGMEIDYFLPEALRALQQGFTEEVEHKLIEVSKIVPSTIETYGPLIVNSFIQELEVGGQEEASL